MKGRIRPFQFQYAQLMEEGPGTTLAKFCLWALPLARCLLLGLPISGFLEGVISVEGDQDKKKILHTPNKFLYAPLRLPFP